MHGGCFVTQPVHTLQPSRASNRCSRSDRTHCPGRSVIFFRRRSPGLLSPSSMMPTRKAHPCAALLLAGSLCALCGHASAAMHGWPGPFQEPERTPQHAMQRPGYLGVSLRDLDSAEATRFNLHGAMGAMIVTVDRDAPAWGAGLRPGDVLLELNGQPVDGVDVLRRRLRDCYAGTSITLRVRRRGEDMSFAVALGDQDLIAQNALTLHLRAVGNGAGSSAASPASLGFAAPFPASSPPPATRASHGVASTLFDALMPASTYTGLEVDPLTPQLAAFFGVRAGGGVLVTAVSAGSPASVSGFTAGDVIVRAGEKSVATRAELARALHKGRGTPVPVAVLRDRHELVLSLLPGKRKKL